MTALAQHPRLRAGGRLVLLVAAIALTTWGVCLIAFADTVRGTRLGIPIAFWGLLVGYTAIRGPGVQAVDDAREAVSPSPAPESRASAELVRERDEATRHEYELRLEVMLRRELEQALRIELTGLRRDVVELRGAVLDAVDGRLRMERVEITRIIGSNLAALQDDARIPVRAASDVGLIGPATSAEPFSDRDEPPVRAAHGLANDPARGDGALRFPQVVQRVGATSAQASWPSSSSSSRSGPISGPSSGPSSSSSSGPSSGPTSSVGSRSSPSSGVGSRSGSGPDRASGSASAPEVTPAMSVTTTAAPGPDRSAEPPLSTSPQASAPAPPAAPPVGPAAPRSAGSAEPTRAPQPAETTPDRSVPRWDRPAGPGFQPAPSSGVASRRAGSLSVRPPAPVPDPSPDVEAEPLTESASTPPPPAQSEPNVEPSPARTGDPFASLPRLTAFRLPDLPAGVSLTKPEPAEPLPADRSVSGPTPDPAATTNGYVGRRRHAADNAAPDYDIAADEAGDTAADEESDSHLDAGDGVEPSSGRHGAPTENGSGPNGYGGTPARRVAHRR